jgi:glycosyltransferase involved in cell wall biosynthesis
MAARAIEILSDRPLRDRMGDAARDVAITRFDVNRIVPMYREMYERVIAGDRVRP